MFAPRQVRLLDAVTAVAIALGLTTLTVGAQGPNVQAAVDAAYAKYRTLKEGKNADYIPALAKVDPNLFGIAVVTPDGKVYTAGDRRQRPRPRDHGGDAGLRRQEPP